MTRRCDHPLLAGAAAGFVALYATTLFPFHRPWLDAAFSSPREAAIAGSIALSAMFVIGFTAASASSRFVLAVPLTAAWITEGAAMRSLHSQGEWAAWPPWPWLVLAPLVLAAWLPRPKVRTRVAEPRQKPERRVSRVRYEQSLQRAKRARREAEQEHAARLEAELMNQHLKDRVAELQDALEERVRGEERYDLLERIESGAMAEVWRAYDEVCKRKVAVKFIDADLANDEEARERFLREAGAAAELGKHRNIVDIYDRGDWSGKGGAFDGRPFFVMPLMEENLRNRLDRNRVLPLTEVVHIGLQVGRALSAGHELGLVHRDIKPQNILFDGDQAAVADYGIARSSDSTLTESGMLLGTPAYWSPEQARGEKATPKSDVYSLAVVLIEAASGIRYKPIGGSRATRLKELLPDAPKRLLALFAECLNEEEFKRPGAKRVEQELQAVERELVHGVTEPPPRSRPRKAPTTKRRRQSRPKATTAATRKE